MKICIHLLISLSLVFTSPAFASWEFFIGGPQDNFVAHHANPAFGLSEITGLSEELAEKLKKVQKKIRYITEMVPYSEEDRVNAEGDFVLPEGRTFSNGSSTIKKTDSDLIIKEFFEGQSKTADKMKFSYEDLLILFTMTDLQKLAIESEEFETASVELSRLNGEDQIDSGSAHMDLLAALVAFGQFRKALKEQESKASDTVKDAGEIFFHLVIQKAFSQVTSLNVQQVSKEKETEYIDALKREVLSQPLSADPREALAQLTYIVKKADSLVHMEKLENVFLASGVILENQTKEEIAQLDILLSELLRQKLIASLEAATESAELQLSHVVSVQSLIQKEIKAEGKMVLQEKPKLSKKIAQLAMMLGFGLSLHELLFKKKEEIEYSGTSVQQHDLKTLTEKREERELEVRVNEAAALKMKLIFQPELMCKAILTQI